MAEASTINRARTAVLIMDYQISSGQCSRRYRLGRQHRRERDCRPVLKPRAKVFTHRGFLLRRIGCPHWVCSTREQADQGPVHSPSRQAQAVAVHSLPHDIHGHQGHGIKSYNC